METSARFRGEARCPEATEILPGRLQENRLARGTNLNEPESLASRFAGRRKKGGHRDNAYFSRNRLSDRGKQHSSFSCRYSEVALLAQRFLETSKVRLCGKPLAKRKPEGQVRIFPKNPFQFFQTGKLLIFFPPLQICVNPRLSAAKKSFPFFCFFVSSDFSPLFFHTAKLLPKLVSSRC